MNHQFAKVACLLLLVLSISISGCNDNSSAQLSELTLRVEPNGDFRWDFRPLAPSAEFGGFQQSDNKPAPEGASEISLSIHDGVRARPLTLIGNFTRDSTTQRVSFNGTLKITRRTRITIEGLDGLGFSAGGTVKNKGILLPGDYNLVFSGALR